jgi:four helix bundle protein
MRGCAVSIPSNIAEGRKRGTRKDFRQFLLNAYGSGGELEAQIEIAKRLHFGRPQDREAVEQELNEVMRMLNVMVTKLGS